MHAAHGGRGCSGSSAAPGLQLLGARIEGNVGEVT